MALTDLVSAVPLVGSPLLRSSTADSTSGGRSMLARGQADRLQVLRGRCRRAWWLSPLFSPHGLACVLLFSFSWTDEPICFAGSEHFSGKLSSKAQCIDKACTQLCGATLGIEAVSSGKSRDNPNSRIGGHRIPIPSLEGEYLYPNAASQYLLG